MKTYFDLFRSLSEELDPKGLQRKFLSALLEMQDVSRGSIWIQDGDGYKCVEALGEQFEAIQGLTISTDEPSIVGWVIENRQMTVAEPGADGRHHGAAEEGLAIKSSKILCFPLFLRDGTVYGAVQVIDTSRDKSRLNLDGGYLKSIQELIDVGSIAPQQCSALPPEDRRNRDPQKYPGTHSGRHPADRTGTGLSTSPRNDGKLCPDRLSCADYGRKRAPVKNCLPGRFTS